MYIQFKKLKKQKNTNITLIMINYMTYIKHEIKNMTKNRFIHMKPIRQ